MKSEETAPSRASVPEMDALIGRKFSVLDDGFVRVVDYMGSDASIVQAARVSYGAGTKHVSQDRALIRYLMRHSHTSPFEMCEIKLHIRAPMDVWRQWVRHRTASINEYSTRYSVAIDSIHETEPGEWRMQSRNNRQGSSGFFPLEEGEALTREERQFHEEARKLYESRIDRGMAREQARKDLPLATYTEAYWKCDLHNLLRFLALRMDEHAQQEIREYASVIGRLIVAKWTPFVWEAFCDYTLESIKLSRHEITLLGMIARGDNKDALHYAEKNGLITTGEDGIRKTGGEMNEFTAKLAQMGLLSPWND